MAVAIARKISDGLSVRLINTGAPVERNQLVWINGFHGVVTDIGRGSASNVVVVNIEQMEIEFKVDPIVNATVGSVLYLDPNHNITDAPVGNKAFLRVTVAKDSNNVVRGIILPQKNA